MVRQEKKDQEKEGRPASMQCHSPRYAKKVPLSHAKA